MPRRTFTWVLVRVRNSHTTRQLGQPRPRLKASLSSLLRDKLVAVSAYGGWDDAFTEALIDVVQDDTAYPEILWTFLPSRPDIPTRLAEQLGRVSGEGA